MFSARFYSIVLGLNSAWQHLILTLHAGKLIISKPRKPMTEMALDLLTLCVQVKSQNGFARMLNGSDALSNFPIFMRLCRGSMISLLMQISRVLKSVLPTSWAYRQIPMLLVTKKTDISWKPK